MGDDADARPVTLEDIAPALNGLHGSSLVLAVSGGADSMALLHLVADWCEGPRASFSPGQAVVATVDHGLRTGSADEARFVAAEAAKRGLEHMTLRWAGDKPATGIQAAARAGRYRLLTEYALTLSRHDGRPVTIVTGHHEDDVAETFLMRLARGSGVRGLAAMEDFGQLPLDRVAVETLAIRAGLVHSPRLSRACPLLHVSKARLVATLRARGLPWIEDPSNANADFERVRVRGAAAALAGLGLTTVAIARSARRLRRAEAAVCDQTRTMHEEGVDHHGGAFASIEMKLLNHHLRVEPAIALLGHVIAAHGGQIEPPGLAQLETLHAEISSPAGRRAASKRLPAVQPQTLGGCLLVLGLAEPYERHEPHDPFERTRPGPQLHIYREVRGEGLPVITLQPGGTAIWDRRFVVAASAAAPPLTVRALSPAEWRALRIAHARSARVPEPAALSLPAFWDGPRLIAVATLDRLATGAADGAELCTARFLHPRV